jgi:hypothetical protein
MSGIFKGTIHGKVIELDQEPGLPDGQTVAVIVQTTGGDGNGIRRSFGAWAEDAEAVDQFLSDLRRDRQHPRPEPEV